MIRRKSGLFVIVMLLLMQSCLLVGSADEGWWDEGFCFRQRLKLPVDVSDDATWFQPVDIRVFFDSPCWAEDETTHSVRVVVAQGSEDWELASQIYNLAFSDDMLLASCNVVFLIPDGLDQSTQFFVYYDEEPKISPSYVDHVSIQDAYSRYEPLSGYPIESAFYQIMQDETIVYTISQQGEFLGYTTGQHVTKHKPNTTEVRLDNGELFAAFDFRYYYDEGLYDFSASSSQLLSKQILVDGPLMVSCLLKTTSQQSEVITTNIYTYYYCPTPYKRIRAQVTHQFTEAAQVHPAVETDGVVAELQCGRVRSNAVSYLNFGTIYPDLFVATEDETIEQYAVDPNPEYIADDPDIRILSTLDDVDLGEEAWACFTQTDQGTAHGILLNTTAIIASGADERNGVQVKAWEMDYPHLPGFENDMARVQFGRNSYEAGTTRDLLIPSDLTVSFMAEFFSTPLGGGDAVASEAHLFQQLIQLYQRQPLNDDTDDQKEETYQVTVSVHHAPSFPLGWLFSTLSKQRFSYITCELYQNNTMISSVTADRISFRSAPERRLPVQLDLWNFSLFKQARFYNIAEGQYVLKVFRENTLRDDRTFIGAIVLSVEEDTRARVLCTAESKISFELIDQSFLAVHNAHVELVQNGQIISQNMTDSTGFALLTAPINYQSSYQLRVRFRGACIYEETLRLGFVHRFLSVKRLLAMQQYHVDVTFFDTWELPLFIPVRPRLIDPDEIVDTYEAASQDRSGRYQFTQVLPGSYLLQVFHKSVTLQKQIEVSQDTNLTVLFPEEYNFEYQVLDQRGVPLGDTSVSINRMNRMISMNQHSSSASIVLPPATYTLSVLKNSAVVTKKDIRISTDCTRDIVTSYEPGYPLYLLILIGLGTPISMLYFFLTKRVRELFLSSSVGFLLASMILPWWQLSGATDMVETSSTLYLIPFQLVSITSDGQYIAGVLESLPDLLVLMQWGILVLLFAALVLLVLCVFLRKHQKTMLIGGLVSSVVTLSVFLYGMSAYVRVGVGGFFGQGTIEVATVGSSEQYLVEAMWGPAGGFICVLLAVIVQFFLLVWLWYQKKK